MQLQELIDLIEATVSDGGWVTFHDVTYSSLYSTKSRRCYSMSIDKSMRAVNVHFKPDDDNGQEMYKENVLGFLRSIVNSGIKPTVKVQIVLYDKDAEHLKGYLTDPLWDKIELVGENEFSLSNPISEEELYKSPFDRFIGFLMADTGVHGGGGGY